MNAAMIEQLWRSALAVIPVALAVAVVCRLLPCRPSTRHLLWLTVLCLFAAAPFLPRSPLSPGDLARWGRDVAGAARQFVEREPPPPALPQIVTAVPSEPEPAMATHVVAADARASAPIVSGWNHETVPAAPRRARRAVGAARLPEPPGPARAEPAETIRTAWTTDPVAPPAAPAARAAAPPEAGPSAPPDALATWGGQLIAVRDAILALPPIPATVWGLGSALLLILLLARMIRAARLLAAAEPAPPPVVRVVEDSARRLGLKAAPATLMTEQRISPLIWCGSRPRLLLPGGLWDDLDEPGRRAVVCHELAHLRRRDHWVCWLGVVVGCLYWWHPIVWWARRHLREEADLCCDAWVTSLMPTARRAYATALLQTKRFTSAAEPAGPVIGLGVTTIRTKRFARRLTMVMSQHHTARTTVGGLMLTAALATASWLVTPALACPPTCDDDAPKIKTRVRVAPAAPKAPRAPKPPKAPSAPSSTFEEFMKMRETGELKELSLEKLRMLEERLPELLAHAEEWAARVDIEIPAETLAEVRELGDELRVLIHEHAPEVLEHAQRAIGEVRLVGAPSADEVIIRSYELPEGKLRAITKLMSRDDVPVLISPGDKAIEVHGTREQHLVFDAFCKMINAEEQHREYRLSQGKLRDLTELMARDDVPVLISPGDEAIEVHGTTLEQAVFRAFVNMIEPSAKGEAPRARAAVPGPAPRADAPGDAREARIRDYEQRARQQMQEIEKLHQVREQLAREMDAHRQRREDVRHRAEEMHDRVRELEREARAAEEKGRRGDPGNRREAVARANELLMHAQQLENEGRMMQVEAEAMEESIGRLEREMEKLEQRIASLERRIDEVMAERGSR